MRKFDFFCPEHPEEKITISADSLSRVNKDELSCSVCGCLMERFFGRSSPRVSLLGPNWPKRDIQETARHKRKSQLLGEKQVKVWKGRMPKLNLDPEVQRYYKEKLETSKSTGEG